MDNKEFKKYKKELKGHSSLKKISNALTASKHVISKKAETMKEIMANRMKRNS